MHDAADVRWLLRAQAQGRQLLPYSLRPQACTALNSLVFRQSALTCAACNTEAFAYTFTAAQQPWAPRNALTSTNTGGGRDGAGPHARPQQRARWLVAWRLDWQRRCQQMATRRCTPRHAPSMAHGRTPCGSGGCLGGGYDGVPSMALSPTRWRERHPRHAPSMALGRTLDGSDGSRCDGSLLGCQAAVATAAAARHAMRQRWRSAPRLAAVAACTDGRHASPHASQMATRRCQPAGRRSSSISIVPRAASMMRRWAREPRRILLTNP